MKIVLMLTLTMLMFVSFTQMAAGRTPQRRKSGGKLGNGCGVVTLNPRTTAPNRL
jgi:hypothetical protein